MELFLILLFLSIVIGCIIAKDIDCNITGYILSIIITMGGFLGLLICICIASPKYSEYNYHTVYTNKMDATITVTAIDSSLHNGALTFKGGDTLNDVTKSDVDTVQDSLISGTITASKNGKQSKKNFDHLIIKGPNTSTNVTKIEYGTETRYPTIFGLYILKDFPSKYDNVQVTLSDEIGSKELTNLLDGK